MKKRNVIDAFWLPDLHPRTERLHGGGVHDVLVSQDCCFRVVFDDGTYLDMWIAGGYFCDGASIPPLAWLVPCVGTPDCPQNLEGGVAHDPLFLTHALPFMQCNRVAWHLWRRAEKPRWVCNAMWAAISSPFGYIAYHNTKKDLHDLDVFRRRIRLRADRAKFASLWFAPQTA